MSKNERKAIREREVFRQFLTSINWPSEIALFESRPHNEPDILYNHPCEGKMAFELVEICSSDVAQEISNVPNGGTSCFIRTKDPTSEILSGKLAKTYQTIYPVHLLCYTAGRTVSPDDQIVGEIMRIIEYKPVKFQCIWLFGDKTHCLCKKEK